MRTYRIDDGMNHLPAYRATVEDMDGDLALFRVHAQDAAQARTKVESLARQYGVRVCTIFDVEPATA
jgi:hypothetical protein